jgi:hypothetical protein
MSSSGRLRTERGTGVGVSDVNIEFKGLRTETGLYCGRSYY